MEIRPMLKNDIDFAIELTTAEGWTTIPCDFEALMSYELAAAFVSEVDGKRVGMVSAVSYGLFGFIGNLIVVSSNRRYGIGRSLMTYAINYLEKEKCRAILLDAVRRALPLYESLGFELVCESMRYIGNIEGQETDETRNIRSDDWEQIIHLDDLSFGGDRSHFLLNIWKNFPTLCYVLERDDEIKGYVLASKREACVQVGPLVVDGSIQDAMPLLEAAASQRGNQSIKVGLLEANKRAKEMIQKVNMRRLEGSIRMVRGNKDVITLSSNAYLIGSPAKG